MSKQRCTHGGAPCPRIADVLARSDPWEGGELAAALRRAQDRLVDEERVPFDVTHPYSDAPDGAVLELSELGRPGWWQRVADRWEPIDELTAEELDSELEQQYRYGYL